MWPCDLRAAEQQRLPRWIPSSRRAAIFTKPCHHADNGCPRWTTSGKEGPRRAGACTMEIL
eukprot:1151808-Pelagomonas_calceolata.AAC.7